MSATVSRPSRLRKRAGRLRRLVPAIATPLILLGAVALPSLASADPNGPITTSIPNDVELTRVFAEPVDPTPTTDDTVNQRILCRPEPRGKYEYLTYLNYDSSLGEGLGQSFLGDASYTAPNVSSSDDLTPDLQAGGNADLCFGFTLTPDMQPEIVRQPATPANGLGADHVSGSRENNPVGQNPLPNRPDTNVAIDDSTIFEGDDMQTINVDMPQGFVGDPDHTPQCSDADFDATHFTPVASDSSAGGGCGDAIVGTSYVRLTTQIKAGSWLTPSHYSKGGQAQPASGALGGGVVFNLAHAPDELARLGVMVAPITGVAPVKIIVRLKLLPGGKLRALTSAPREAYQTGDIYTDPDPANTPPGMLGLPKPGARPRPLYIEAFAIRAWGAKTDHPLKTFTAAGKSYTSGLSTNFGQWGTNCTDALHASADVTTHNGVHSAMDSNQFTLTGCNSLEFHPSIEVTTEKTVPGVPTGATVRVSLGQTSANGLGTALLKDAKVTLPKGLELGAQIASGTSGLTLCTAAQFAKDDTTDNNCPDESAQGTVAITSPLLTRTLTGKIYLGQQSAVGELPPLYLQAGLVDPTDPDNPDAARIKLVGKVTANADGSLTTEFDDAPQLRFSELQLEFPGGEHALFVTPRTCDPATSDSTFTSWAGQSVTTPSSITMHGCDALPGFAPKLSMSVDDTTVGASSPTTITISRDDTSPWLKDVKVALPTGFLSDLNAASECSATAATTGDCPDSSRIGSVTTTAGAGNAPISLDGKMFLVERQEGAVAGAAIVVHAKLGELDLGNVVVPARIDLRPTDAGLVLTTTAPTRFKNLALFLRTITVKLDRTGFPLNPTACGPLQARGDFGADTGATATSTSDVTFTGCAARPFQPGITAELTGALKEKEHPGVHVTIAPRKGDSNLKSTTVMLPEGVSSDPGNINGRMCSIDAFNAGNCQAISKIGTVKATVSITPDHLTGDVFMVKVDGERLPGIGMAFSGRYTQRVLSRVKIDPKTSRLLAVFEVIPDLPLTSLDLTIDGGAAAPIQLSNEICTRPTTWEASFGGQGGQSYAKSLPFDCSVPAATQAASWTRKSGLALTVTAPAGKSLKTVRITLPKGFKIVKSKSSLKKNVKVSATGGTVKPRVTSRVITLTATGATGPTLVKLVLKPKGYRVPSSMKKGLKKGTKLNVATAVTLFGGTAASSQLATKVK